MTNRLKSSGRILGALMLGLLVLIAAGCEKKAGYPTKPITLIVPYGAGGTTDLNARKIGIYLEKYIGQPITVVNKPGASGAIATKFVYDAPGDGYTVLYSAESPGTFQVMGISELNYDEFLPLALMVNDPKVVVVNATSKYSSIQDLVADIKANPGKIRMSYSGPGASGHIQGLLYDKAGLKISMTSFGGGNPALLAVMGDQVDFTNANLSSVLEYFRSGKLKHLAAFSNKRDPAFPDVPAITEVIPELGEYLPLPFPQSILVKKDTPKEVVKTLSKAIASSLADPEWKQYIKDNYLEPLYEEYKTESEIRQFCSDWTSRVSWLLYDNHVTKFSPEKFNIAKPTPKK